MKYFGGCDVGSTYTKCIILDENGNFILQFAYGKGVFVVPLV